MTAHLVIQHDAFSARRKGTRRLRISRSEVSRASLDSSQASHACRRFDSAARGRTCPNPSVYLFF